MNKPFEPISRDPAYARVARAIEARILAGDFDDGAPLPTEAELCAQFDVTRSTVREGIRLLERAGLVARGAGKRLIAARPEAADVARAASRSLSLSGATFREVWECLVLYYPPAADLAARRADKEALGEMRKISERLGRKGDEDETVKLAVAFFEAFAQGLDNRVLLATLQSLNLMIEKSLAQVIADAPRARRRIAKAQAEIVKAIEEGDAAAASRWMRSHIDDLKRGYDVAGVEMDAAVL